MYQGCDFSRSPRIIAGYQLSPPRAWGLRSSNDYLIRTRTPDEAGHAHGCKTPDGEWKVNMRMWDALRAFMFAFLPMGGGRREGTAWLVHSELEEILWEWASRRRTDEGPA